MPKDVLKSKSKEELEQILKAGRRLEALEAARDSILGYARLMMPDPEDIDDAARSMYDAQPHHRLLAEALERVERGEVLRVCISMPPQHGKTQLCSRYFAGWYSGRNPRKHVIFGAYNQDYANENGAEVREIMRSAPHRAVFPKHGLRRGSTAKDLLQTNVGGKLAFVGRGGAGTGKPADLIVIDDALKNEQEAESPVVRKELHGWYDKVISSRIRNTTAVVIIATRWHEDDLIGRLTDPEHPQYDADLAADWVVINIPAVVHDEALAKALGLKLEAPTEPRVIEAFGPKPMSVLWPAQFSPLLFASAKKRNAQAFNALYMGKPAPDDGDYFKKEWLLEYGPTDLPSGLRKYGASDHAVTEKQENDATVLGCVGVDSNDDLWVLPDLVWDRMETDRTVEELLEKFRVHRPQLWWMESELISKSFGPFLHKRMVETKTYCTIDAVTPTRDKRSRARSIQGRLQMKKVRFPKFAPWWPDAKSQMLKFPFATNDDFVDFMSWIGLGLTKEVHGDAEKPRNEKVVAVGSIAWIKAQSRRREEAEKRRKAVAGW